MTAKIYVLEVTRKRLEELSSDLRSRGKCAVEVLPFDHSRSFPLVVLISTEPGMFTHVAEGKKSIRTTTNRFRLDMKNFEKLDNYINFEQILSEVKPQLKRYAKQKFENEGLIPHATSIDVAEIIREIDPSLGNRLSMLSRRRLEFLRSMSREEKQNLAIQKECLSTALELAGIDREALFGWDIREDGKPRSVLEGLSGGKVGEDVVLARDWSDVPGFQEIITDCHASSRVFISDRYPKSQLTVIMANRADLEKQTGADLIYCNDTCRNFVMVQYKAMERNSSTDEAEFRWQSGDHFTQQIAVMDVVLQNLRTIPQRPHPDNFRFSDNPFFLKFFPRVPFDPDKKEIAKGMYLPLDYWKCADQCSQFQGPQGGKVLTYRNVGRYITNTDFKTFISSCWVGTSVDQSSYLAAIIREVIESGKTLTLATQETVDIEEEAEIVF